MNIVFKNPLEPLDLNEVQYLVIHHAKAKSATPEQIHQWHLENGWSGFGYNEYIRKDGSVFIGRGDNIGAHCADNRKNYNTISYGICLEGDYDLEEIPQAQMASLIQRIKYNQQRMKNATVVPHRKLTSTECPGKLFPWDKLMVGITMPTLKFGTRGDGVSFLQTQLRAKGYDCGRLDGMYGVMTKKAVVQFQKANELTYDGIVGPLTWGKLLNK